jgi:hypothetical protein
MTRPPISEQDLIEIARAALEAAKDGNMYGAEVVRRLWRDRPRAALVDLPPIDDAKSIATAQGAVIVAASTGHLATREALDYATMLEYRRRALHSVDFEARLKEVEDFNARQRK